MLRLRFVSKLISKILIFSFIFQLQAGILIVPKKTMAATAACTIDNGCDGPNDWEPNYMYKLYNNVNQFTSYAEAENRLKIEGFDKNKLEEFTKFSEYLRKNPNVSYENAMKAVGVKELQVYDIRLLRSLYDLVTPAKYGGGDLEWLRIESIVKGYTCPVCKMEKDIDPNKIKWDPYSPHYQGKSAKISEIDLMRMTKVTKDDSGKVVKKEKYKKEPIKVAWQTDQPGKPGAKSNGQTALLNQSPLQLLNSGMGNTFNNWLSDTTGIDYTNMPDTDGRTPPQIIKQMGAYNLNDYFQFPAVSDLAFSVYNLESLGWETGGTLLAQGFKDVIGKYGFVGSNLENWMKNIGRTTIEDRLGLPNDSLNGENSEAVLSQTGERKMESELMLSEGSLANITSRADVEEKIGAGYLYKINMEWWNFTGKNYSETRTKIGEEKFDSIFSDTNLADNLLSIPFGTTESYKSGQISTLDYKKKIGQSIIDQKILIFGESDKCDGDKCVKTHARDEALGVGSYNPDPNKTDNPKSLVDRFLLGDNSIYKEIGINIISRSLTEDEAVQELLKNWLKNKIVDQETRDGITIDKINLGDIAKNIGLRQKDLQGIFIDNYPQEIFERMGDVVLLSALGVNSEAEINSYLPYNQDDNFYNSKFEEIKSQAKNLQSNKKIAASADKIIALANSAVTSKSDSIAQVLTETRKNTIINNAYDILGQINFIENTIGENSETKTIKYNDFDVMEGRTLTKPESIKADDITGILPSNYYGLTNENIVSVLKDEENIDNLKKKIGLEAWSAIAFNSEPEILNKTLDKIKSSKNKKPSEIITNELGQDNIQNTADELNSEFSLGAAYAISTKDLAMFLNGDYKVLFKIGDSVFDSATSLRQGATGEILSNKSSWDQNTGQSGINNIWEMFRLGSNLAIYNQDMFKRLSQNFLESNIGLLNNTFYGTINDIVKRNGLDQVLNAFGVTIPSNILSLQYTNPAMFNVELNNFFATSIQNPASDFWKNFQNTDFINLALQNAGFTNMNFGDLQSLFSGKNSAEDMIYKAGNIVSGGFTNEAFNTYYNLENKFNQAGELLSAMKAGNVGSTLGIMQGLTNINIDSQFGGLPFTQMLSSPQNALKNLTQYGLNTLSSNLGPAGNLVNMFFQQGNKSQDIINGLAGAIGQYTNIPIASAMGFLNGNPTQALFAMGTSQLGSLGINLPLGDLMTAVSGVQPGSALSDQAWANAMGMASKTPGWGDLDSLAKNHVAYKFYQDELGKIQKGYQENLQYSLMDTALAQALPGSNFSGTFKALMKGSSDDKIMAGGMLLSGLAGSSEINRIISDAKAVSDLAKFLKDPKGNAVPMSALNTLGQQMNLPPQAMQALGLALSGNKDNFMKLGESFMVGQIFGLMDGGLGSGAGSMMYQAYNMAQQYSTLTANVSNLQNLMFTDGGAATAKQLLNAQMKLDMFTAGATATLATMALSPVLSQIDQAIGFSGLSSMLLSGMIYQATVPGLTSGALLSMMGPQIALVLLGGILGGGLLGGGSKGGKTEIIATSCGYWPLFEEKKKGPDGKCPEEFVIKENTDKKKIEAYNKKVAQYKIKIYVNAVLKMPNEDKIGKLLSAEERKQMLPTQIRTYDKKSYDDNFQLAVKQYKDYDNIENLCASMIAGIRKGIYTTPYLSQEIDHGY